MNRKRSIIIASIISATLAAEVGAPLAIAHADTNTPVVQCQEDQPCWTWSTMGDHKRGVRDTRTGAYRIVGPCAFKRMVASGTADRSEPMRGDWHAIRTGCR